MPGRLDLPPRYRSRWKQPFEDEIAAALRPGMTILDIGAGRHPTLRDRPSGTTYIGLDPSESELVAAGDEAYDETYVVDIVEPVPSLVDCVDLAVSWQVFEHVKPLDVAFDNIHSYLRSGGTLVSLFSGKWSAFGVVNQAMPNALARRVVEWAMDRSDRPVFPAFYHRCSARQLRKMTAVWDSVEIVPMFVGATYFSFSPLLARAYLWYEEQARARNATNLATHYLLVARK